MIKLRAFGEVLANESVGILVRAPLPRAPRVSEVDLHAGINRELLVFAHLLALIVGERFGNLSRQNAKLFGIRFPDTLGILGFQGHEDGVAGGALHQGAEGSAFVLSHNEIAFPVAGDSAVGNFLGTFLNGEHIGYFPPCFLNISAPLLSAVLSFLPECFDQRLLERSTGKYVDVPIDRLVRDAHGHVMRILLLHTDDDLAGRPVFFEFFHHIDTQLILSCQPALAIPAGGGAFLCMPTRRECAVSTPAAVAAHFTCYGTRRSTQTPRDCRATLSLRQASARLLALVVGETPVFRCILHTGILYSYPLR